MKRERLNIPYVAPEYSFFLEANRFDPNRISNMGRIGAVTNWEIFRTDIGLKAV